MAWFFSRRTVVIVAVIVAVFLLASAAAQGKVNFSYPERVLATVLSPVEGLAARVGYGVRGLFSAIGQVATVYRENQMLRQQNEQLQQASVNASELAAENARLKAMLAYKQDTPQFDLLAAVVVGRDPGTWSSTIVINRGTADGVTKDMPVITPQGLVGSVIAVYGNSAKVQLFLDPHSAVGGIVQRPESRVTGIVNGSGENPPAPRMVNLARDADIVKGDKIVTSGLGGLFPKGIMLGEVIDVVNDEGGLLKYAILKPAVDFSRLEEVFVLTHSREPAPVSPTAGTPPLRGGVKQ